MRSGQPGINGKQYASLPIPLPPTNAEQRAIAEALSDADALIESLEKLIAKKREIKQGVMQELLSGRKRLPGFGGRWEKTKLGTLGIFLKGRGVTKDQAQSGDLPCVRYGELYTDHHDVVRRFRTYISREVAFAATRIQKGDILFAGSGETKAEIGKCAAIASDGEAYAGGDIVILRVSEGDTAFLGYALNQPSVQQQKATRGQGDAVVHISAGALASIELALPDISEQVAISAIISELDEEIQLLSARTTKTCQFRQGIMQGLLTGRVRLV